MKRLELLWIFAVVGFIFLFFVLCTDVFGSNPQYFKWRWSNDSWTGEDKQVHFFESGMLYGWLCRKMPKDRAMLINMGIQTLWEVKDGFIPWELAGPGGGDGFSYKDLIYDAGGMLSFWAWDQIVPRITNKKIFGYISFNNNSTKLCLKLQLK